MNVFERLCPAGPSWSVPWPEIHAAFDWVRRLDGVPQDAVHHAEGDVANCAITEYRFDPSIGRDGNLVLVRYNVTAPMKDHATPVTSEPDAITGRRG